MPRSKASPRRGRSPLGQEKYTAELSSGQLVIGVVILLMFGLACFLLGVLIGKFDPSLQPRVAQQASSPDNAEAADANRMAAANPPQRTTDRTPPARRDVPPAPSQSEPAVVGKQAPIQGTNLVPKEADHSKSNSISDEPEESPAAESSETLDGPSVSDPKVEVAEAPAEPAEPVRPEPAPDPPRAEEVYAVQIHAFRPSARARAENAARDFAARSNYETFLAPSDNGQWLRVFAGKFVDRAAAARARDEIRRQYGDLSKCFVPASPISVPRT